MSRLERKPLSHRQIAWIGMAIALLVQVSAFADTVIAKRRVAIRNGPSSSSQVVGRLEVGQAIERLASDAVNGFVPVRTTSGESAWVYRTFVAVREQQPADGVIPSPIPGIPSSGSSRLTSTAVSRPLQVRILNVGQGDAILLSCPDGKHQMLIDSGDTRYPGSSDGFRSAMAQLQRPDDPIEVVIATHPHADHIGSMNWVLRTYRVGLYVDDGMEGSTVLFRTIGATIAEQRLNRRRVKDAIRDVTFCPDHPIKAQILRPEGFGASKDPNENSVVVRVDFGSDSFLFVGDAEHGEEELLLRDPKTRSLLRSSFLKLGHHGSDTSSTEAFIAAVAPDIAVISSGSPGVGTNARYKHPRASTVSRLQRVVRPASGAARRLSVFDADARKWRTVDNRSELYSTAVEGELLFESTGNGIRLRPVGRTPR